MSEQSRARSWVSHGAAAVAGLVVGVMASPLSNLGDVHHAVSSDAAVPDRVPPTVRSSEPGPAYGAERSSSRPRASARGAEAAAEEVAQLTARLQESAAANARLTRSRDDALARASSAEPSLLDRIFDVSPREGLNARQKARSALEAARRNRIETHWADVVGPDVRIEGSDLHACFSRFYAELTSSRTQADTRRLFEAFAPLFRERMENLRREDKALRARVSKGDYPDASVEIRTRIWNEGDAMLDALGELVNPAERTERRLRGSTALGIPDPSERLRIGWKKLLGEDLNPPPSEVPAFEPFTWVYATLARERSREELRKLYHTMCEAYDSDDASKAYEGVKSQLSAEEWRLLRFHPTDGDLPLSQ